MTDNNHLLLAYDGSSGAKAAIDAAGRLFAGRPALIVSVCQSAAGAAGAGLIAVPAEVLGEAATRLDEESRRQAELLAEEGAAAARRGGIDASAKAIPSRGNTWSTLVRVAEDEGCEAIVVGSRGRSAVSSVLLGSVSSGVVHHSPSLS